MNETKIAIVTGASSGIGFAITAKLLEMDYEVYGFGRSFSDFTHPLFHPITMELSNTQALQETIRPIVKTGNLCLLINNAGVGYFGPHEELSAKQIHEMVSINLELPMILTSLTLRTLKQNHGTIINLSSITATKNNTHGCAYGATKAGLSSFGNSLFEEVRKYGVRVITIQPDMTKTQFYRNSSFEQSDAPDAYLTPDELADAVEYALSLREGINLTELTLQPQKHQIKRKG